MVERTGSFSLMNLAEDFGLDYGDVIVVADFHRDVENQQGRRLMACMDAGQRIDRRLEERAGAREEFWARLGKWSRVRWAPPKPAVQKYRVTATIDVEASCELAALDFVRASLDDAQIQFAIVEIALHG